MKINGIFEVVPESLYSVRFDGESHHEFSKIFRLWSDVEYLESFFICHHEDLLTFWEYMTIEEAVAITLNEAINLEETLLSFAEKGCAGGIENLSSIFKPLHARTSYIDILEKSKARGFRRRSWMRVYALRLGVNYYVVTGGAIKLTRTMNEREHLNEELKKLEVARRFLKTDQESEFGLFELF